MKTVYRYILILPDGKGFGESFETLKDAEDAARKLTKVRDLEYVEIYSVCFVRQGPADFQTCVRKDGSI